MTLFYMYLPYVHVNVHFNFRFDEDIWELESIRKLSESIKSLRADLNIISRKVEPHVPQTMTNRSLAPEWFRLNEKVEELSVALKLGSKCKHVEYFLYPNKTFTC